MENDVWETLVKPGKKARKGAVISFGDGILMGVLTIATASPTATMCMIFAVKYDKNSTYASELFAVTTLLSLITIPLSLFFLKALPV